jgi:hypothetical protein
MTNRSRIAAFLSASALCLGLTAAPAVFAADAGTTTAKPAKTTTHKHKAKSGSKAKKQAAPAATPAK